MKKEYFSKLVDEIISEIQKEEDELDEITVTGNVDGYNTPNAFKKTDGTNPDDEPESDYVKRINTGTGYTKVNEAKRKEYFIGMTLHGNYRQVYLGTWSSYGKAKKEAEKLNKSKVVAGLDFFVSDIRGNSINENRWHQLRKEDSTPNRKIGVGIRNIRKQLSEIELFLNWYSKLKNENGLSKETYWKRTNKHLNAIRERLYNISQRISKL